MVWTDGRTHVSAGRLYLTTQTDGRVTAHTPEMRTTLSTAGVRVKLETGIEKN